MRSPRPFAWILALAGACGSTCEVESALDYTDDDLWLCRPGVGPCEAPATVHTLRADGGIDRASTSPVSETDLACFVVYPTVDLRPGVGLHHQIAQVDRPARWLAGPPRLLAEVCTVWAPVYRQVTIGTYVGQGNDRKDRCFENAYGDVEAAFSTFLEAHPTAGIAVFGHSQGGQHLSRLLSSRVQDDPELADRLVVAWPLGWSLGTEEGEQTGGSFSDLPICSTPEQTGCAMGYRSFYAGRDLPTVGRFGEGEAQVCTHPALPPDDGPAPLAGFVARADDAFVSRPAGLSDVSGDDLIRWDDVTEAQCVGEPPRRALQVRWTDRDGPPFDPGGLFLSGDNGTHVLDVQLGMVDIVADVARRADAWRSSL